MIVANLDKRTKTRLMEMKEEKNRKTVKETKRRGRKEE